jgi:hypothetical protein
MPRRASSMANSNPARPPGDCAHPSTRTRHRRPGRKLTAGSTRGTPFGQRLTGLGTGPPRRHSEPTRIRPHAAEDSTASASRPTARRLGVGCTRQSGCGGGCWSSRTRSGAGPATSSGATGLHGPCATAPARPTRPPATRKNIKAIVSGWPGKIPKEGTGGSMGVGRSGVSRGVDCTGDL